MRRAFFGLAIGFTFAVGVPTARSTPLPPGVSDLLMITDDSGTPVTDSDGNPAVAMILKSAENTRPLVTALVTLTVGSFQFGSQGTIFLVDEPPLPGCGFSCPPDLVEVATQGSGGLRVTMCSGACPTVSPFNPGVQSVLETGQPQEIDVLPSPIGSGNLHVIVDSIDDAVPEPSTAVLLTAGLGVLSIGRRRGLGDRLLPT
jgi:hypothetical protein